MLGNNLGFFTFVIRDSIQVAATYLIFYSLYVFSSNSVLIIFVLKRMCIFLSYEECKNRAKREICTRHLCTRLGLDFQNGLINSPKHRICQKTATVSTPPEGENRPIADFHPPICRILTHLDNNKHRAMLN